MFSWEMRAVLCAGLSLLAFFAAGSPAAARKPPAQEVANQSTPRPSPAPVPVAELLGRLDGLAQDIVADPPRSADARDRSVEIGHRWPGVRARLVGAHARRGDLVAADSATQALSTQRTQDADLRRAANGLTAALAPLYAAAADRVPARLHRLDFIGRSIGLDVGAVDWVRAGVDLVAARTTWRNVQPAVTAAGATAEAKAVAERLTALQDAVGQRSGDRARIALAEFDRALGGAEKAFDHQEPAWRRWIHQVLHV